jgi:CO/xanthine dehydrogenase Mo-binding subunit
VIKCFEAVTSAIGWDEKWHEPGTRTLDDGRLHGIGIAGLVESHSVMGNPIGAIINMNRDGTVLCNHGITRVGCGTNSALDAIVAETLGLDYEDVMTGDWGNLDVASEAGPQSGSRGVIKNGAAFQRAAEDIRDQLFERAAPLLGVSVSELSIGDKKVFVTADPNNSKTIVELVSASSYGPLIGRGNQWTQVLQQPLFDWPVGTPCETRSQGASAVEVAVDPETGEVEILNFVTSPDTGRIISFDGVEKQGHAGIEHQIAQALYWEQIIDKTNGASVNPNYIDHKYPTTLDVPQDKYDVQPGEPIDACGPYGAKGSGSRLLPRMRPS